MKKLYSFIAFAAILCTSMCMLTSCGDDENEIEIPKKEDPKDEDSKKEDPEEEDPNSEMVRVFCVEYGVNLNDIYDVTLSIYRDGKKQDVLLSTTNSVKMYSKVLEADVYHYFCSSVNGVEGVDSVVAVVATKPNIEAIIASMDKSTDCDITCAAGIAKLPKVADGDYSGEYEAHASIRVPWDQLLVKGAGTEETLYELFREKTQKTLSVK